MYIATLNNNVFFRTDALTEEYSAISASLKIGTNIAGELNFQIAPGNIYYDTILESNGYVSVYRDKLEGKALWSGRINYKERDINLLMDAACEGALTFLTDSKVFPFDYEGPLGILVDYILQMHNDAVSEQQMVYAGQVDSALQAIGIDIDWDTALGTEDYVSAWDMLSYLQTTYGGYMTVVHNMDTSRLELYWQLKEVTGEQTIQLTKNLLDIKQSTDAKDIITAAIPLGTTYSVQTTQSFTSVAYSSSYFTFKATATADAATGTATIEWTLTRSDTAYRGYFCAGIGKTAVYAKTFTDSSYSFSTQTGTMTVSSDDYPNGYINIWMRQKTSDQTDYSQRVRKLSLNFAGTVTSNYTTLTPTIRGYNNKYVEIKVAEIAIDPDHSRSLIQITGTVKGDADSYYTGIVSGVEKGRISVNGVPTKVRVAVNGTQRTEDWYDGTSSWPTSGAIDSSASKTFYVDRSGGTNKITITFWIQMARSAVWNIGYNSWQGYHYWYISSYTNYVTQTITATLDLTDLPSVLTSIPVDTHTMIDSLEANGWKKYVENEDLSSQYGIIPEIIYYTSSQDAEVLYSYAKSWLAANSKVKTTIDVEAVDLADAGYDIEHFDIGQTIEVTSAPHGLEDEAFMIEEMSLDLYDPSQNKLVISKEE